MRNVLKNNDEQKNPQVKGFFDDVIGFKRPYSVYNFTINM